MGNSTILTSFFSFFFFTSFLTHPFSYSGLVFQQQQLNTKSLLFYLTCIINLLPTCRLETQLSSRMARFQAA